MALLLTQTHDFHFVGCAPGDIFYRGKDGLWTNLPGGEPGQFLQTQGDALQWASVAGGSLSPTVEAGWLQIQLPAGEGNQGFRIRDATGVVLFSLDALGTLTVSRAFNAPHYEENGMPAFLDGDSADHSVAAPTAAAGSKAGSTPPVPVVAASARDYRGSITFGTGTSALPGDQVVVTFNAAFDVAPKSVVVTPLNQLTASLGLEVSAVSTSSFTVGCNGTPTSSKANTTYGFYFAVFT